jgi:hypothetical protein
VIGPLLVGAALAGEAACLPVGEVPESVQVVWISPVRRQVAARGWLEVVRLADLESWAGDGDPDAVRLLQAAGLARKNGRRAARTSWKATIFDVERDWMCRPIEGQAPGTDVAGIAACDERATKPLGRGAPGYTGCGHALDTANARRGFDVYRIRWEDAASQGFCVMPFDRFLAGL